MVEDLPDHHRLQDECEDPHLGAAFAAEKGVDLVDPANELRPGSAESPPLGGGGFGSLGTSTDAARRVFGFCRSTGSRDARVVAVIATLE
jgi:hypothetical protein